MQSQFYSSLRYLHNMLFRITPFSIKIIYLQTFLFGFILLKHTSYGALSIVLVFSESRVAISLLRGIVIMTIVLPQWSHLSFIDHSCPKCKIYIREMRSIFQLSFLIHVTILPLEMWHKLYCHNFENHSELLWMRRHSMTYFIHMIMSYKQSYFLIRMGVHFPHSTSWTQQSLYRYFCKSCSHVLILWFACNFLLSLNSFHVHW
jgi:hypothetical protein